MTLLGKDLAERYYGQKPRYSYWYGCSQGGRQGMSEVQRYPDDYDGVWAAAPALDWTTLIPGLFWPVVAQRAITPPPAEPLSRCLLDFMTNASVAACDADDGARDGFLGNAAACHFDPAKALVGREVSCDDDDDRRETRITEAHARVWNAIRHGLHTGESSIFYGLLPGANMTYEAVQPSFAVPKQWIADFVLRDPDNSDLSFITSKEELLDLVRKSVVEWDSLWGTNEADISPFAERGGKLITYHGWWDQFIPPGNTLNYWDRVVKQFGGRGRRKVDDFYRVFMVPGLPHCYGGDGPQPDLLDTISPLVEWVENGKAPETIRFEGNGKARDICKWPRQMRYKGAGDVAKAESWTCL
ncbi:Tannase/feruloyl esterase [Xylariaceae sp. FL0594]|nr:Tannase/feruloyl esterase [Xylariaceae sp. FL0594]